VHNKVVELHLLEIVSNSLVIEHCSITNMMTIDYILLKRRRKFRLWTWSSASE